MTVICRGVALNRRLHWSVNRVSPGGNTTDVVHYMSDAIHCVPMWRRHICSTPWRCRSPVCQLVARTSAQGAKREHLCRWWETGAYMAGNSDGTIKTSYHARQTNPCNRANRKQPPSQPCNHADVMQTSPSRLHDIITQYHPKHV